MFSRKFLSLLAAGLAPLFFTGCGGGNSSGSGYAPDMITGYLLQLAPGTPTSGGSPGLINVYQGMGSFGLVDVGTQYTAQVEYIKTGDNTAKVAVSLHVPDNTSTATTYSYNLVAEIVFTTNTYGNITKWEYYRYTAGQFQTNLGAGNSGDFTLKKI